MDCHSALEFPLHRCERSLVSHARLLNFVLFSITVPLYYDTKVSHKEKEGKDTTPFPPMISTFDPYVL